MIQTRQAILQQHARRLPVAAGNTMGHGHRQTPCEFMFKCTPHENGGTRSNMVDFACYVGWTEDIQHESHPSFWSFQLMMGKTVSLGSPPNV